jgi:hypothetical protein
MLLPVFQSTNLSLFIDFDGFSFCDFDGLEKKKNGI